MMREEESSKACSIVPRAFPHSPSLTLLIPVSAFPQRIPPGSPLS